MNYFTRLIAQTGVINIRHRARMIDRVKLRVIDKIRGARRESMAGDLSMHKFRGRHCLINLAKTNGHGRDRWRD